MSEKLKVVFLDRFAIRAQLRSLRFPHDWFEYPTTSPEQVIERLQGATIAITNRVHFDADILKQLPDLRLIAMSATGYECIDISVCRDAGVTVTNLRDWSSISVAEHAFAMMLGVRRQLLVYRELLAQGEWQRSHFYGVLKEPLPSDLYGCNLGIIGYGALGERIAHLGSAFGMNVMIADRKGAAPRERRVAFREVVETSDVLCITCPFNEETRNLIGRDEIAMMKPTATLINTARGGIVDEQALADALREGRIGGAGVDVLAQEPPRNGNPLLDLSLPNLIVTPHMAFASHHALNVLAEQLMSNIESFVAGHPKNVVS
ncbi:D-2-hydroxyacid dehydrogenase [Edaphobacter modestus]|uniref:Glycerate dehydrogenase n=1 Tax=Edaphobacter modestus TaxID=388466 RepID=A0A4Q7Z0J8_9BACT|nr:D-2-hydroxyacid dehydrogenase [Edaphobacter modestus]RZU43737.1 glycerate dehydrogenase [Edaphobacter modestus]